MGSDYDRIEKLFLKGHRYSYLLIGIIYSGRNYNQFVIIIIGPVYDSDTSAGKILQWFSNTQDISIQTLTIR